jgi:aminomethyltransferase
MKSTKLNKIHKKLGAKLFEFAGYEMPFQYSSIIDEHKAVRNSVGVFDVSHMGEIFVRNKNAFNFVQNIITNDASRLTDGKVQYTAMCYPDGGIVDDLLVYRFSNEEYLFVVNASNIKKDFDWMTKNNDMGVEIINRSDDFALLAVQGPNSKKLLEKLTEEPIELDFYTYKIGVLAGKKIIISRTGYTGELGYELYFEGDERETENIWNAIIEAGKEYTIKPIGLGARDTLRLEMGYCLYGNDIDHTTNTFEAGLGWITKLSKGKFIGSDTLSKIKADGITRKLVALVSEQKAYPRKGYDLTYQGNKIGYVTSGTISPMLNKPIALGYVDKQYAKEDETINFLIRGKEIPAKIVKLPFYKL